MKTEKKFLLEKLDPLLSVLEASPVAWITSWMQVFFLFEIIKNIKNYGRFGSEFKVYQHIIGFHHVHFDSVADTDPGSGSFLTLGLGSGIGFPRSWIPNHIYRSSAIFTLRQKRFLSVLAPSSGSSDPK